MHRLNMPIETDQDWPIPTIINKSAINEKARWVLYF
jgi:hypothetical protein